MMLKQIAEASDRKAMFYPGGKNSVIQLGSYQEMVFQRNPKNKITFGYQWSSQGGLKFQDPISKKSFSGDTLSFDSQVEPGNQGQYNLLVKHFKYELLSKNTNELSLGMIRDSKSSSGYKVKAEKYELINRRARPWPPRETLRFYAFPVAAVANYQNADIMQNLNSQHENFFQSLCYLGLLRIRGIKTWVGLPDVGFGRSQVLPVLVSVFMHRARLHHSHRTAGSV